MHNGHPGAVVLRMSIPMIVVSLSVVAFNLVDTYFVGRLGSIQLAAMGYTLPIKLISGSIAMGIGIGASSSVSNALGAGERERARRHVSHAILLAFAASILLAVLGLATIRPFFGMLGAAEEVIGDLAPGDSTTVTVDAAIAESVSSGLKPLDIAFTYRDGSGIDREAPAETASLAPAAEQSFSIADLADTLSVGYDGEVTGTLVNDGPRSVDDAVLIVEPQSDSLFVEDTRYALPELDPGEQTQFRYPTDVSGQADPGPRQLQFSVEYTGGDRSTLTDGPISQRVDVGDRQDEFSISDDGVSVAQGESSEIELELTNERSETLSNIDARLYTDSPLDASNDEAFVPELAPGESATIAFEVEADEDAATETHPIELDFEYDTERGETKLSDTYQHPIEVVAATDEGSSILSTALPALVILSVAALGIGTWVRRR